MKKTLRTILLATFWGIASHGNAQSLVAWGDNLAGQCSIPAAVASPHAISAGAFHALALQGDGTVVAWGKNADGQTNVPSGLTSVLSVAAGGDHSLALQSDGTVVGWGRNWDGQTDAPLSASNLVSIAAGWAHSLALRADGTVVAWGNNDYGQTSVSFLAMDVVAVAAGYYHNLALRADGRVVAWGADDYVPATATNVMAVDAGWGHSLALKADGRVLAWGDNTFGQATVPPGISNAVGVAAGYYHSLAWLADGSVVAWGKDVYGITEVPTVLTNVAAISTGEDFNLAVSSAGPPTFILPPQPIVGYLGGHLVLNPEVQTVVPALFHWSHEGVVIEGATNRFLALENLQTTAAGNYALWVSNRFGAATSPPLTVTVRPPTTVTAVGAWGSDVVAQCDIPAGLSSPRAIAAGDFHGLVLQADGTVVAWGKNTDGQATVPDGIMDAIAVAAGGDHSLVLRADGSVVAWGRNWDGQTSVPTAATGIVQVAAGYAHGVALRSDGTVLGWGNNDYRQANVPSEATNILRVAAGYHHTLALRADHRVLGWGLPYAVPDSATNIVEIAGGWRHSLALRADGTVIAWGDNSCGQVNVPVMATNIVAISAGYGHSWALRADGEVVGWGTENHGVTTVPAGLKNVASIAAGENHVLGLVEAGPPRFSRQPTAKVAHVGAQVILDAAVSGSEPMAVQWHRDGDPIPGASTRFLTLPNVQLADAGNYTLLASNVCGQTSSAQASLSVLSSPRIETVPNYRMARTIEPVVISASVSGAVPMIYRWQCNGKALTDDGRVSGAGSPRLTIDPPAYADAGDYSLVVSNAAGSVTGLVAHLVMTPVLGWGDEAFGQLRVPIEASNVVAVSAGESHSLGLLSDGRAIGWGDNSAGQASVPPWASNLVALSAGGAHSLALTANGEVLAWGDNSYHQTEVPSSVTGAVAVAAGARHSVALLTSGVAVAWGDSSYSQCSLFNSFGVVEVAAGDVFSMALRTNNTGQTWPVAFPNAIPEFCLIAAGAWHQLALSNYAGVFGLERGNRPMAVPPAATSAVGIAAGGEHSLCLLSDGGVLAWGADFVGQAATPVSVSNAVAVAGGGSHSLALGNESCLLSRTRPLSAVAALGGDALLVSSRFDVRGTTYQWQLNDRDMLGATNYFTVLPASQWVNYGSYRVIVSNLFGVFTSNPVSLSNSGGNLRFETSPGTIRLTAEGLQFRLTGAAGAGPIVLYVSTNLVDWDAVFTNPPASGSVNLLDPSATNRTHQFYRASELQSP